MIAFIFTLAIVPGQIRDDDSYWKKVIARDKALDRFEMEPEMQEIRLLAIKLAKRHKIPVSDGQEHFYGPYPTLRLLHDVESKILKESPDVK